MLEKNKDSLRQWSCPSYQTNWTKGEIHMNARPSTCLLQSPTSTNVLVNHWVYHWVYHWLTYTYTHTLPSLRTHMHTHTHTHTHAHWLAQIHTLTNSRTCTNNCLPPAYLVCVWCLCGGKRVEGNTSAWCVRECDETASILQIMLTNQGQKWSIFSINMPESEQYLMFCWGCVKVCMRVLLFLLLQRSTPPTALLAP